MALKTKISVRALLVMVIMGGCALFVVACLGQKLGPLAVVLVLIGTGILVLVHSMLDGR